MQFSISKSITMEINFTMQIIFLFMHHFLRLRFQFHTIYLTDTSKSRSSHLGHISARRRPRASRHRIHRDEDAQAPADDNGEPRRVLQLPADQAREGFRLRRRHGHQHRRAQHGRTKALKARLPWPTVASGAAPSAVRHLQGAHLY